MIEDEALKKGN